MHLLKISKNLRDTTSKLFLNGGMISYIKTYILNNGYISSDKYIYEPQKSGGMAPFIPRSLTMAHCDAPFAMGFAMVYYPLAMAHDNGKSMKNPNLWVMFPANKNLHD